MPCHKGVHSNWRCRLFWNFFTNNKINNFEVYPHHCSSQKLVYSLARCAKWLLTWHIAWNYLHGLATRASSTGGEQCKSTQQIPLWSQTSISDMVSTFSHVIKSVGFRQSKTDYSLFTRQNNSAFTAFWFMWMIFFWQEMIWHKFSVLKIVYYNNFALKILET